MFGVLIKAWHRATIKSLRNLLREDEPVNAREVLREACFLEVCGGHPHIVGFRGVAWVPHVGDANRRSRSLSAVCRAFAATTRTSVAPPFTGRRHRGVRGGAAAG